jgi:hypothetical protein
MRSIDARTSARGRDSCLVKAALCSTKSSLWSLRSAGCLRVVDRSEAKAASCPERADRGSRGVSSRRQGGAVSFEGAGLPSQEAAFCLARDAVRELGRRLAFRAPLLANIERHSDGHPRLSLERKPLPHDRMRLPVDSRRSSVDSRRSSVDSRRFPVNLTRLPVDSRRLVRSESRFRSSSTRLLRSESRLSVDSKRLSLGYGPWNVSRGALHTSGTSTTLSVDIAVLPATSRSEVVRRRRLRGRTPSRSDGGGPPGARQGPT